MTHLQHRVALVTGSAPGIGNAIAERFGGRSHALSVSCIMATGNVMRRVKPLIRS
jgi:NAD(P)-dependent dehydrogenase (short-subunit alcohol dehydrogenase family)